ncbi:hypothetical protein TNCV_2794411 [Trichonephila clavipes]|uniref:Uncharacterized protein n=1 Tax=Trichonephila inaurata madagascariensis TaxID=2747483 RepID=A0A8X6WV70_9ARAC|nr:hypothetical protein TNCV_2794411 [Trichonephila clavipes]GFY41024.1 hypothetical protein TNIN_266601 [Trichonephila inaurata madagascariensis]
MSTGQCKYYKRKQGATPSPASSANGRSFSRHKTVTWRGERRRNPDVTSEMKYGSSIPLSSVPTVGISIALRPRNHSWLDA